MTAVFFVRVCNRSYYIEGEIENMETKLTEQVPAQRGTGSGLKQACLASCQRVLAQINDAKAAIFAEYRDTLNAQEQLLRQALNEAEAMAWQTGYPHLLFPALATEKIQAAAGWNEFQRAGLNPTF